MSSKFVAAQTKKVKPTIAVEKTAQTIKEIEPVEITADNSKVNPQASEIGQLNQAKNNIWKASDTTESIRNNIWAKGSETGQSNRAEHSQAHKVQPTVESFSNSLDFYA